MHKINRIHIYSLLLSALLIHLTVLNYIKILGAKPDLMLIIVIFFGLFLGWRIGLELGLVAGLLKDIFAIDIFWTNTFILGITGYLSGILSTKFFKESKATQTSLVFLLTIFSMLAHFLNIHLFTRSLKINLTDYLFASILPTAIYTAIVSILIFSKFVNLFDLQEDADLL